MPSLRCLVYCVLLAVSPSAAHADMCSGPALAPFTEWLAKAIDPVDTTVADDGRLVVRLDHARAHRLRLSRAGDGDEIALESVAGDPLIVNADAFSDLLLRCVRFEGFDQEDQVTVAGLDAGFVARRWRVPVRALGLTGSAAQKTSMTYIDALTEHGALGAALAAHMPLDAPTGAVADTDGAIERARRNTVAMVINADAYANVRSGAKVRGDSRHVLDVGGGILLRLNGRLVVVTAAHIVPRRSPNRGVLALAHDGALIPLRQLLHGGRRFDLAVFGFADPAQEIAALDSYGGVHLADTKLSAGAFVFHIGFPDRWQTNEPGGPVQLGAIALPWTPRPIPVLTSGLINGLDGLMVRASARLAQGDSGGGFFIIAPDGAPRLIGPASTVRSDEDGNPPGEEVASHVTGGIFRLHLFDLPRLMPNYFAEAEGGKN